MGGEWQPVELGAVADIQVGYAFKSSQFSSDTRDPRLLRGENVGQGFLKWDNTRRWSRLSTGGLERYWLREGDVIVAMDRPWIPGGLKYAVVSTSDLPALLVQRVARMRGGPRLDSGYLRYMVSGQQFTEHVLAVQTGTTIPHISAAQIMSFRTTLPPLSVQRAIASILGALDDKIELNRRMSETLEEMARALFKAWFVDFEGFDRFQDSDVGRIPLGWSVGALSDLMQVDKGVSYKGAGLVERGGLPMVNLGCFAGDGRFRADKVKNYAGAYKPRHLVSPGDVVLANTDMTQNRVVLGSPAIVPDVRGDGGPVLFSHHVFACRLRPDSEQWRLFVYFSLTAQSFREVAEGYATGTTVLALRKDDLLRHPLVLPPLDEVLKFNANVQPILDRSQLNADASVTLAGIRDTLLPKLISGELRVPDAERLVSEAVLCRS